MKNMHETRFNMNLIEKDLSKVNYTIYNATDIPGDNTLLFPFVTALAREDDDMVLSTINRYLFGLLGKDEESALAVYRVLKESWGVIKMTLWGDELAHLYSAIKLCFMTGAMARVIATPNNIYQGFVLIGSGYTLYQYDVEHTPVTKADFVKAFKMSSPHTASLMEILDIINFPDDMERANMKSSVCKTYQIGLLLRQYGYNANDEDRIRRLARNLVFPLDNPLPITSINVTNVLTAMFSESISEENFPLHYLAILEKDRRNRLLSAFGSTAPSFLVPGGRSVSLDGNFEYQITVKGKKEVKTTTRMFAIVVPLAKACEDLATMLVTHSVNTPIATPLAGRASSFSMIREYSGAGGASVLGCLRSLCGVSMTGASTSAAGKRKRDEDPESSVKKAREDFEWD
jgi:hypothetical protein